MLTTQDAPASQPVTKNHPPPSLRKYEIVSRLRELVATSERRLTWNEREAVLAAICKLDMQP